MENTEYTDQQFLDGIKNNDSRIIKAFYKTFFPLINKYVEDNNGKKEDAEDLFQNAVVVIYRKLIEGNFELTSKLKTFVYAICQNQWRNKLKKNFRESGDLVDDDILSDNDITLLEKTEKYKFYRSKFKELQEDCRKILTMVFDKIPYKKIAEHMKTTEGYIKRRKYMCKNKLIELVKSDSIYAELIKD